jgi:glycosyltransferase involved in cell wall biosynthesis
MRDKGVQFLNELFESLKIQSCQDFEVIVSDHSKDDRIWKLCTQWEKVFTLRYLPYAEHRGEARANRQNAIKAAVGDIIKPMDQDDFMYSKDCLSRINEALHFNPEISWGLIGYIHTNESADTFYNIVHSSDGYVPKSLFKPSTTFYKRTGKKSRFIPRIHALIVSGAIIAIREWPFQAGKYVTTKQLSMKDRRKMAWLSTKRIIRKYILNKLQ